ncbi:hypothetical protein G6011_06939 [Alternaria panax]|uniref:GPI anchored serine-rich protein n=1 Tax=Alternaria panax TaxID=48097 RepID=A0AAD4I4M6_9PLEO|nr:hypothetical protein G6011_06939 [Alternaria panax]
MRFSIVAASLVAAVAAQYPSASEEVCSAAVTVTVTETLAHTPVAPSGSSVYYPTTAATPSSVAPVMGGTMVPDASSVGTAPVAVGTAAPTGSGTGAPYPEFTGAASSFKVGGALAGVAGVAALFL